MNKKQNMDLNVISGIDDEIIDKNTVRRITLKGRLERRNPKRGLVALVAAVVMLAMLSSVLLILFIPTTTVPDPGEKQVPIYEGMTVLSDYDEGDDGTGGEVRASAGYLSYTSGGRLTLLSSETSEINGNNGNHYGHGKKPVKDIVDDEITIDIPDQDMYYANPHQDIYINIHILNPDSFEILSFTLNGKKYSSYMFEAGSDMENLIIKCNVGDAEGIVEYTIDAIKYVDGTEIKDVIMEGDRTVCVGVYSDDQPKSEIANEVIAVNKISLEVSLADKLKLIEACGGKAYAVVCDDDRIIAQKELFLSESNKVEFEGLATATVYRYAIVANYDSLDGTGINTYVLYEKEFTTQRVVAFDNVDVGQEKIVFSFDWNESFDNKMLKYLTLYRGEEKVSELEVNAVEAVELLSNNEYRLVAVYMNMGAEEIVELTFKTQAKALPTVELTAGEVTQTSFGFDVAVTDTDNVGEITKIELIHGEDVTNIEDLDTRSFTDLLSNNEYTVRVNYTYDLNDGVGDQIIEKTLAVRTAAKAIPEVTVKNKQVTKTSFDFDITVTDADKVGEITKLEFIHGEDATEIEDLSTRSFTDLLSGNQYTVKVTYTYDLNDGIGDQIIEKILTVKTVAKATPVVEITESNVTQTSFDFDITVTDADKVGEITKLELIHGEDATNIEELDTRSFTDLLSNNEYTVKVTYTYDLNDGKGARIIEKNIDITTLAKAEPSFVFNNVTSDLYMISGEYALVDADSTLLSYSVKLFKGDELVEENAEKKIEFDSLDYYTDYTVNIAYFFDLNDGLGIQTGVTKHIIKTRPYLKVNSATVRNTGAIIEGDTIYLQTILDNPLSADIVSLVVNGKTYSVSSILSDTNVFVEITNDGQFDGGETELFVECVNIKLDGVNYKMTFEDPCSDKVFINGKVKLISTAFVNKNLDPVYWGMPDDEVYLLFTVDNPTGYDIKKINLLASGCSFDNDTESFEGEVDLSKITVIDDDRFYIPINTSENCSAFIHSVFLTYGNEYVSSLTVDSTNKNDCEYFDPIPYYKLATNEIRYVSTAEELMAIESGYYYEMTCDIDLSDISAWSGIEEFSGVFNGNGYSIKNASIVASNTDAGIFKEFVRGVIENVKLENLLYMITSTESENEKWYSVGGLVAKCKSAEFPVIRNCTLDESSIIKCVGFSAGRGGYLGGYVGGICGNGCRMIDCISYGTIDAQATYVGGIMGDGKAFSCENYGMITVYRDYGSGYFGGVVGVGNVLDCVNYGDICVKSTGETFGYDAFVGGICGETGLAERCVNYGDIVQNDRLKAHAGGIVGGSSEGTCDDCINYGNISSGCGIIGYRSSTGKLYIRNCINIGNISGENAGGISYIGGSSGLEVTIEGCVNIGKITGTVCGGIIKGEDPFDTIKVWNCYTDVWYPSDACYDGVAQCSLEQLNSKDFYIDILSWSEDIWEFSDLDAENGKYPTLK